MKKIISLFIAFALVLSVLPMALAEGTATVSISASASNVTVGDQVSFSINFSGTSIGSYQYTINYDPDQLEYIGFDGDGEANGAGGAVVATGEFADTEGTDSIKTTVTFKAKQVGSAAVSLSGIRAVDYVTITAMATSGSTQSSVNIAAKPEASTDNTLKSLSVSPSGLTPAFSSSVTEYSMQVEYATSSLIVSATPNHGKAKVSVSGAGSLAVGDNTVKIVVTAESGDKKTYTIKVNRKASDYSGVTATVDGTTYTVAYEVNQELIPEGYTQGESTYGDRKMVSFSAPGNALVIVRLVDSDNVGTWYIYDAATESFKRYITTAVPENNYVILDMPADAVLPEGFSTVPQDVAIGDLTVKGYASEDAELADFYLVYAMDKNGMKGIYVYDSAQGTLQRYAAFTAVQVIAPVEDPEPQEEPDEQEGNSITTYALLAAAVLLFVGGIVLLVVLLKRPAYKSEEDEEDIEE